MATLLTRLRFDQAANLVDDPANQHAKIVLFKRRVAKGQPSAGSVHVDSPDWLKKDCEYLDARKAALKAADVEYLKNKRRSQA